MGNLPLKKFRAGQVTATIWENKREIDGKEEIFKTTTIEKNYKDGEEWKTTNSFNINDLYRLQSVVNNALNNLVVKDEEIKAKD